MADAFQDKLRHAASQPGSSPTDQIARACAAVLPFDAAGLSITLLPGHRWPLGASDPRAAMAEQVQFTVGDGPCFGAQQTMSFVSAPSEADLQARWPVYAHQLMRHTPFRSVHCLPVGGPLARSVVLDLFRVRPGRLAPGVPEAVEQVAAVVGTALAHALSDADGQSMGVPAALRTPSILDRQQVWLAVSKIGADTGLAGDAAMALLRALAFDRDLALEEAAARILRCDVELPKP